jgi:hypothetical protein
MVNRMKFKLAEYKISGTKVAVNVQHICFKSGTLPTQISARRPVFLKLFLLFLSP